MKQKFCSKLYFRYVYVFLRWLRCALEVEQDTVNAQKLHLDELKKQQEAVHERDASTIQAITKYVSGFGFIFDVLFSLTQRKYN